MLLLTLEPQQQEIPRALSFSNLKIKLIKSKTNLSVLTAQQLNPALRFQMNQKKSLRIIQNQLIFQNKK